MWIPLCYKELGQEGQIRVIIYLCRCGSSNYQIYISDRVVRGWRKIINFLFKCITNVSGYKFFLSSIFNEGKHC